MLITDINLLAKSLGILSLVGSGFAFFPTIIKIFKFYRQHQESIATVARFSLIATIFLGLLHGLLTTQKENINFYDLNTYWVSAEGLLALNLLILLAFTFPDIKQNLNKLTYFTYAALFLLGCHVWQQVAYFWG